jgi:hypothetical protein
VPSYKKWEGNVSRSSLIDQLQPVDNGQILVYQPYYREGKRTVLPRALSLYQKKSLEGERKIEGGESIPFVATWTVSTIPADLIGCRMQFSTQGEQLSYEVKMANFEFVDHLIDLLINYKNSKTVDFSKAFYRKLLRPEE